ncbi:reverse transcriptase domain-containing protein [Tanacetum coccineum]
MKKPLRKLLYEKGNLHVNVIRIRDELDRIQTNLDTDPFNVDLRESEANSVGALNEALIMEEHFLKQKAKIDWLREGDSNSAYFFKAIKSRVSRSRIDVVTCADGTIVENEKVTEAFVSHYEQFLGLPGTTSAFDTNDLFHTRLDEVNARDMVRIISRQEVKDALFSMGNEKSPGPDGYTAAFFKESWDIIADDLFDAVSEFFINGKILKELNHTIIALIPKNKADNILLTPMNLNVQLRTWNRGPLGCGVFKVDIQKAYDTVDWGLLKEVLIGFGFHNRMIGWIMECVTTTSFSISINCSLHGFFKVEPGLRSNLIRLSSHTTRLRLSNGDPYPCAIKDGYVIPMRCLSTKVLCRYGADKSFVLSDDHFLFCIARSLLSGRVPTSVSRWENKSLSVAGRLQLVKSVIGYMHVYWGSVFVLPSRVLLDIEQIMRGFLWCHGDDHKGAHAFTISMKLISLKESLWVKWIHAYKLKGRSFWDYPLRGNMSWGWRKVLQLRPLIRDFIRFSIGLDLSTKVCDIVVNGVWNWPPYLSAKYPFLNSMAVPNIVVNTPDRLVWHNSLGVVKPFSVAQVWSSLRPRNPKVPWSSKSVIAKLVVAASAYFVWQERNNQLFKNNKRMVTQLIGCIMSSIRLKLLSCCFKKSREGVRLAHEWSLPDTCFR